MCIFKVKCMSWVLNNAHLQSSLATAYVNYLNCDFGTRHKDYNALSHDPNSWNAPSRYTLMMAIRTLVLRRQKRNIWYTWRISAARKEWRGVVWEGKLRWWGCSYDVWSKYTVSSAYNVSDVLNSSRCDILAGGGCSVWRQHHHPDVNNYSSIQ
jgi:hypothetical protein